VARREIEERTSLIQQHAKILRKEEAGPGVYLLEVHSPQSIALGRPGQFLYLRSGRTSDPLLRRPVSIFSVDRDRETVGLLFRLVGRGTEVLSRMAPGSMLDLLGPLGRGFSLPAGIGQALLVAGGLGVAPLFFLAQVLVEEKVPVRFLLGARRKEELLCVDRLQALQIALSVSTDDGSEGFAGLVTDLLEKVIRQEGCDPGGCCIYSTGPEPMMTRVASLAREGGFPAQFSLERHMACGVGACLGCAIRGRSDDGGLVYRRVCADGPVFHREELIWSE
jgi:dihydroorotate dehydrogenase electron transfer subunit